MPDEQRPNVLFLFADDMQWNTIHQLGNDEIATPNLDRLAARGVAFTNAHVMGGRVGAICCPSRACLMTGRHLFEVPVNPVELDPDWITVPQLLQQHGYRTFGTGKWHQDKATFNRSFSDAGNIFFGGMHAYEDGHFRPVVHPQRDPTGAYPDADKVTREVFSTDLYAGGTIDFIREQDASAPFYAYLSFTVPHDPRHVPERYLARYRPDQLSVPPNFMPQHPFDNGDMYVRDEALLPYPRRPTMARGEKAVYYAMITHMDECIGQVLDALEQQGLSDNTYVVFAADNGLALGQHGLFGKQNLYEHSSKVPMLIAGPGIPARKQLDTPCYLHQINQTVLQYLGVDPAPTMTQSGLREVIEGGAGAPDLLLGYMNLQRALKTADGWKYIEYRVDGTAHRQLYYLPGDPYEIVNLAPHAEHAERVASMRRRLAQLMRDCGDEVDLDATAWPVLPGWRDAPTDVGFDPESFSLYQKYASTDTSTQPLGVAPRDA